MAGRKFGVRSSHAPPPPLSQRPTWAFVLRTTSAHVGVQLNLRFLSAKTTLKLSSGPCAGMLSNRVPVPENLHRVSLKFLITGDDGTLCQVRLRKNHPVKRIRMDVWQVFRMPADFRRKRQQLNSETGAHLLNEGEQFAAVTGEVQFSFLQLPCHFPDGYGQENGRTCVLKLIIGHTPLPPFRKQVKECAGVQQMRDQSSSVHSDSRMSLSS